MLCRGCAYPCAHFYAFALPIYAAQCSRLPSFAIPLHIRASLRSSVPKQCSRSNSVPLQRSTEPSHVLWPLIQRSAGHIPAMPMRSKALISSPCPRRAAQVRSSSRRFIANPLPRKSVPLLIVALPLLRPSMRFHCSALPSLSIAEHSFAAAERICSVARRSFAIANRGSSELVHCKSGRFGAVPLRVYSMRIDAIPWPFASLPFCSFSLLSSAHQSHIYAGRIVSVAELRSASLLRCRSILRNSAAVVRYAAAYAP